MAKRRNVAAAIKIQSKASNGLLTLLFCLFLTGFPAHPTSASALPNSLHFLQQQAPVGANTEAPKPPSPQAVPATILLKEESRYILDREFSGKIGFAKIDFPRCRKAGCTVEVKPDGSIDADRIKNLVQMDHKAIPAGQYVEITRLELRSNPIMIDLNGGGLKGRNLKKCEGCTITGGTGGMGGPTGPNNGQGGVYIPNSRKSQRNFTKNGVTIEITFPQGVPEMTPDEFAALLRNVVEFPQKKESITIEEPLELVPEQFRDAVRDGKVLVGMTVEIMNQALIRAGYGKDPKPGAKVFKDVETWIFKPSEDKQVMVDFLLHKVDDSEAYGAYVYETVDEKTEEKHRFRMDKVVADQLVASGLNEAEAAQALKEAGIIADDAPANKVQHKVEYWPFYQGGEMLFIKIVNRVVYNVRLWKTQSGERIPYP